MPAGELIPVQHTVSYPWPLDIDGQSWIAGVAVNDLLVEGGDKSIERVKHFVDTAVTTQNDTGQLSYSPSYPIEVFSHGREYETSWELTVKECMNTDNSATIGHSVPDFYDHMGENRYLDVAERAYESLLSFERIKDGGIPRHDPELAGIKSLWIDSVYMACPLFARYGTTAGDADASDEAVEQVLIHAAHLYDGHMGPFRHIWVEQPNCYSQGTFQARGNGQVAATSAGVLERLPEDCPKRDDLLDLFQLHCEAFPPLQDGNGFWHNLIGDPHTPLEPSGVLTLAYAFARGIDPGILNVETCHRPAEDGLAAISRVVGEESAVNHVAGPPGGPEAPLTDTSYGQGWLLTAAAVLD